MSHASNRVSLVWVAAVCAACALVACTTKNGNDGNDTSQNGAQGMQQPGAGTMATGTGGSTAGQAPATGSGGSPAMSGGNDPEQNGGGSGGKPAMMAGSGGSAAPSDGTGGSTEPTTPSDGGAMMASDSAVTSGGHGDLGKGDGSDVVTIGDSWMQIATNGGGIEGALDRAGTSYRHYSVPGTLLLNGQIPGQYDQAKAQNPDIKTVIMTGGGNDIMFSNGCATKESCTMAVQGLVDGLNDLWTKMDADGVKDVIYIAYSKNAGTAPSDTRPDMVPTPKICVLGQNITCHNVDTTDLVGATDTVDGIHPTLPACDAIAKRVLDMMEMEGVRR
jgi:hypothetical protein